jgi:molybdenum cofactor biosynthesis enzyme MoaA
MNICKFWCDEGLKNIRFSGGEPTLYHGLLELVKYCKSRGVERIALSTNGSAKYSLYEQLIAAGVNDFSISLDSCCASESEQLAGRAGTFDTVIENIRKISRLTYTTIGCVVNEVNVARCLDTILFMDSLGVADIRVIPSAQYNLFCESLSEIPEALKKYPILKYRSERARAGNHVRGIQPGDSARCSLMIDDMAIAGDFHFPCIIHLREGGSPVGKVANNFHNIRRERFEWAQTHDSFKDPICTKNCLDVCVAYNNKCMQTRR